MVGTHLGHTCRTALGVSCVWHGYGTQKWSVYASKPRGAN